MLRLNGGVDDLDQGRATFSKGRPDETFRGRQRARLKNENTKKDKKPTDQ